MSISLKRRKCALITGGTRNIGRAVVLSLAKEGVACVVVSRRRDADAESTLAALEASNVPGIHFASDVTDEGAVRSMFADVAGRFDGVDIVVHCAAIRRQAMLADITLDGWREVMATNLDAAFICSKAALPYFPPDGGRIVYFSGVSAFLGIGQRSHVVASKLALVGLARALATELADRRITVNCVSPGAIETERGTDAGPLPHLANPPNLPAGRRGAPEEVAAAVLFLVSDAARYITGQVIHVNGGVYYG